MVRELIVASKRSSSCTNRKAVCVSVTYKFRISQVPRSIVFILIVGG
jgi:hypothetical protein